MDEERANSDSRDTLVDSELEEFKRVYYSSPGGRYNLDVQAEHLARLADRYVKRYVASPLPEKQWTDLLKAHTLYNSAASRVSNDEEQWTRKCFEVQSLLLTPEFNSNNCELQKLKTQEFVHHLEMTREECRRRLSDLSSVVEEVQTTSLSNGRDVCDTFYKRVSEICVFCTDRMVELIKLVFEFLVDSQGCSAPSSFCIVALGSLAKGEATPYSDFEYMFIIKKKDEETMRYFKNLALASYLVIGNMRETKLESMDIAELKHWFTDTRRHGFQIDGLKPRAGNMPTGNGHKGDLIFTPSELIEKYNHVHQKPDMQRSVDGDFTAMLQYTRTVYQSDESASDLLATFHKYKVTQSSDERVSANIDMFKADSAKFDFTPTDELRNRGFSVYTKNDLYRYPSILLFNLSILLEVVGSDSWVTLETLKSGGFLSTSIHEAVAFLLACSCYFRLSTYLFYDSKDDRLSVLPVSPFSKCEARLFPKLAKAAIKRWYLPQELFNKYCEFSIPLKDHIGRWDGTNIRRLLLTEFPPCSWLLKFQIYHYCSRWSESQSLFEQYIDETLLLENPEEVIRKIRLEIPHDFQKLWNCVKAVTYFLGQRRHENVRLMYNEIMFGFFEKKSFNFNGDGKTYQTLKYEIKAEIGWSFFGVNKYDTAILEFKEALNAAQLLDDYELKSKMHLNIGRSYNRMYDCEEGRKHLLRALQLCSCTTFDLSTESVRISQKRLEEILQYLSTPTAQLAYILWAMGTSYLYCKEYNKAILCYNKCYEMSLELYGKDSCHSDLSNILYRLGMVNDCITKGVSSSQHYLKALAMTIQLYGSQEQSSQFIKLVQEKDKKSLLKFILKVFPTLSRFGSANSQSAIVVSKFALHLTYNRHYEQAEYVYQTALKMFEKAPNEDKYCYPYIAHTYSGLALNAWKTGNHTLAESLYKKAVSMLKYSQLACVLLDTAEIIVGEGDMYVSLGELAPTLKDRETLFAKAEGCYILAKGKQLLACSDTQHVQLVEIEGRLESLKSKR